VILNRETVFRKQQSRPEPIQQFTFSTLSGFLEKVRFDTLLRVPGRFNSSNGHPVNRLHRFLFAPGSNPGKTPDDRPEVRKER